MNKGRLIAALVANAGAIMGVYCVLANGTKGEPSDIDRSRCPGDRHSQCRAAITVQNKPKNCTAEPTIPLWLYSDVDLDFIGGLAAFYFEVTEDELIR